MKLATFRKGDDARIGLVHEKDSRLFDLAAAGEKAGKADPAFTSMLSLIDGGPAALDRARELFQRRGGDASLSRPLPDVELLAPVPEPRQMRDGMLFPTHILQAPRGAQRLLAKARGDEAAAAAAKALPELAPLYRQRPIYYFTNRYSVSGPGATVRWPRYSKVMDFELEFGIFLGKTGTDIPASKAREHIFGYTIYNDFSARDAQMNEMPAMLGPTKGKSFQGGNVLGPWIVTADEIPDARALKVEVRVNGETWSKNTTAEMLFSFEEVIAFISSDETLHAGEFIGSGTVGNCCGLELDRYLQHGDQIELQVERIGVLRNKVIRQDV
jgi:2-keto-4-pentenoate hydratase/2-oxohepta-3-ene-1,7-dioic acid hydratase in catechol pathway